jgi:hypothetical protein
MFISSISSKNEYDDDIRLKNANRMMKIGFQKVNRINVTKFNQVLSSHLLYLKRKVCVYEDKKNSKLQCLIYMFKKPRYYS